MRDYLLDIIKNTFSLGKVPLIKIVGTQEETKISAVADERLFVVNARLHNPNPDFIGRFGMPNLSRLLSTLNTEEYREDAKITVVREKNQPTGINFENKAGDFKNYYRFMDSVVVDQMLPDLTFSGATWHVEIEPTVQGIQRMKFQSANTGNDDNIFYVKTDANNNVVFKFGDPASVNGEFVFYPGASGTLRNERAYSSTAVLNILSLNGDKTMKFSNDGVVMITVDSGLAVYNYILLAQQK